MGGIDWIGLAQDRDTFRALVNAIINLGVPENAGKLSSVQTTGGLSSSVQLYRVSQFTLVAALFQLSFFSL
jgi:D-Tyr-tRNAtyr deacylase